MLHATIHNKTSRWLKEFKQATYRSDNDDEKGIRIPREDEITSTVFGPLQYLNSRHVYYFIKTIAEQNQIEFFDDSVSISHQISFWPSKRHKWDSGNKRTEPDIVFYFDIDGKKETYIFELKWGHHSKLGNDQLEREWAAFQLGKTRLIYLATNLIDFKSTINPSWVGLTWLTLSKIVKKLLKDMRQDKYVNLYLKDLNQFFNMLDIREFDKFSELTIKYPLSITYLSQKFSDQNIPTFNTNWRFNK